MRPPRPIVCSAFEVFGDESISSIDDLARQAVYSSISRILVIYRGANDDYKSGWPTASHPSLPGDLGDRFTPVYFTSCSSLTSPSCTLTSRSMFPLHAFASVSHALTAVSRFSSISALSTRMYALPTLLYVTVSSFTSFR